MTSFEQFIASFPSKAFDKGQTLLLKGDVASVAYVIESGLVKVYSITANGGERLIAVLSPGEEFPIGLIGGLIKQSDFFYEAYTKCVIRMVPEATYIGYLRSNQQAMYHRHIKLTLLLLSALSRIDTLEHSRAGDKIASTLLYMAEKIGVQIRPSNAKLKLSVTQQEIANSLGLTRETASIELKKLELKKLITHSRNSYILYINRLRNYIKDREDN